MQQFTDRRPWFAIHVLTYCLHCSSLKKHNSAVSSLLRREIASFNKESAELLSALLDFLRQILNNDSVVNNKIISYSFLLK